MFKIRFATQTDIPRLQNLIAISARGLSRGYYSAQQIESAVSHVFGVDTQLIDDGTYFIVESENEMVGCGGWSKRKTLYGGDQYKKKNPDPLLDQKTEPARIRAFFVHPDWGRRGIGRILLKTCSEAALKAGFPEFELGSTLPGVPFYSALGFRELEPSEVSLPDGVQLPIIRMRKSILNEI